MFTLVAGGFAFMSAHAASAILPRGRLNGVLAAGLFVYDARRKYHPAAVIDVSESP